MRLPLSFSALALALVLSGPGTGVTLSAAVSTDLEVQITFTIPNTAPVVDLDGAVAGIDHQAVFTIGGPPASIVAADSLTVVDVTSVILAQAQVRLLNRPDGLQEALDVSVSGGIARSWDAGTGVLTLTGPATASAFQTVLRSLTYANAAPVPDVTDRIVQVTVEDGALTSPIAVSTVSLVPPINHAPVVANALPDQLWSGPGDQTFTFAADTFFDADGDALAYAATWDGGALPAWLSFTGVTRTWNGNPPATAEGVHVLAVTADDGRGGTATATCTLTIQTANDVPLIAAMAPVTTQGVLVAAQPNLLDPDSTTFTWTLVQAPLHGHVLGPDPATGAFTYLPATGFIGTDALTLMVNDGVADSPPATITITIAAGADQPRPWITSDPPQVAWMGEELSWTVQVDVSELASPDLHIALEDAPAGMQLTMDPAHHSALVTWPLVTGPPGYRPFRVLAWDAAGGGSHVQEVTLLVLPVVNAIAAWSDEGQGSSSGIGVSRLRILDALLGGILRPASGTTGIRTVVPRPRSAMRQRRRDAAPRIEEEP